MERIRHSKGEELRVVVDHYKRSNIQHKSSYFLFSWTIMKCNVPFFEMKLFLLLLSL